MQLTNVSIDRLTILGDLASESFITTLSDMPFVKYKKIAQYPYRYSWHMIDGSILQLADASAGIARLRYEFNPNNHDIAALDDNDSKWNPEYVDIKYILRLFRHPRLSRIDIAMDLADIDLAAIQVTDSKARTETIYKGRDKKIETYYFGTRRSDVMIRIYNKAREQGKEYASSEWWRAEVQINGDLANAFDAFNPWEDVRISYQKDIEHEDIRTRAMLHYLRQYPEAISELSVNSRSKYKELLKAATEEVEISLAEIYEQKKEELRQQLNMWINQTDQNGIAWENIITDGVDISMPGVEKAREELERKEQQPRAAKRKPGIVIDRQYMNKSMVLGLFAITVVAKREKKTYKIKRSKPTMLELYGMHYTNKYDKLVQNNQKINYPIAKNN